MGPLAQVSRHLYYAHNELLCNTLKAALLALSHMPLLCHRDP